MSASEKVDTLAKIIWDYMLMHHELRPVDAILVLGTNDIRVAERGAELYHAEYAPVIIASGYRPEKSKFLKSEAEVFSDVLIANGVPREKILLETEATNTEQNITFVRSLLEKKHLSWRSFILVQKPYMERRTWAVFQKQWPLAECLVTSPEIAYENYANDVISKQWFIESMVGDLQRIKEYPKLGFQIEQVIPELVWQSWEELVRLGYTRRMLK